MSSGTAGWNARALVSQVHGQTNRWVIVGGITSFPTGMAIGSLKPEKAAHNIVSIMLEEYLASNILKVARYIIKDPTGNIVDRGAYTPGARITEIYSVSDGVPAYYNGKIFYDVTVVYKEQAGNRESHTNQTFHVTTMEGYPDRLIIYQ